MPVRQFYQLFPPLFIALSALAAWIAFFPGFMSPDSLVQYGISHSLAFNDWQPPIMSLVWLALNPFFPGPSGMLALQLALFGGAIYLWWRHYQALPGAWVLVVLPLFPWVSNFIGVMWKDVVLAGSLLLLAALMLRERSFLTLGGACLLTFFSVNLRYNALAAVFPLVLYGSYRWLPRPTIPKAVLAGAGLVVAVMGGSMVLNDQVLHVIKTHPTRYMMVDDLSYLSIRQSQSYIPGISLAQIQACNAYDLGENRLVGRSFCLEKLPGFGQLSKDHAQLTSIWISKIAEFPGDYLRFRLAAFSYLLRTPGDTPYYYWHAGVDQNDMGIHQATNPLTYLMDREVNETARYLPDLFKPYLWLLIALLVLSGSLVLNNTSTTAMVRVLLISAVLYILGYVPATQMADFRYVYWSVVATTLSVMVLLVDWPGINVRASRWRFGGAMLCGVVSLGLVLNHGTLLALNVDDALNASLRGQRHPLPAVDGTSGTYDAHVLQVAPQEMQWLKFDFQCLGPQGRPVVRVYFMGDGQPRPLQLMSLPKMAANGANILALQGNGILAPMKKLDELRFRLSPPGACQVSTLSGVEIISKLP